MYENFLGALIDKDDAEAVKSFPEYRSDTDVAADLP